MLGCGNVDTKRALQLFGREPPLAPHFDAVVARVTEKAANERLLGIFGTKYAGSFDSWRDKMRDGFASGDRVLLRYTPA